MERFAKKIIILLLFVIQNFVVLSQTDSFLDSLFNVRNSYGCYIVIDVDYGDTIEESVVNMKEMYSIVWKTKTFQTTPEIYNYIRSLITKEEVFHIRRYDHIEKLYNEWSFNRIDKYFVDSLMQNSSCEDIIKTRFNKRRRLYKYRNIQEYFAISYILFKCNIITYVPRERVGLWLYPKNEDD